MKNNKKTIAQEILECEQEYIEYDFAERKKRRKNRHIDTEIARENIGDVKKVFEGLGIKYCLLFGTLLGAVRAGDFIPHDTDTDIGVFIQDRDKIVRAIRMLNELGFRLIRTKFPDDLATIMRNDEYIDLGIFRTEHNIFNKKYYVYQDHRIYRYHFTRLQYIPFLGEKYPVPYSYKVFLNKTYGKKWHIPVAGKPAAPYTFFDKIRNIRRKVVGKNKYLLKLVMDRFLK